jgi:hypothetical protein
LAADEDRSGTEEPIPHCRFMHQRPATTKKMAAIADSMIA